MEEKLRKLLKEYNIDTYISYLKALKNDTKDGKPVNYWFNNISAEMFAEAYKKVAKDGIEIDGDTVTLNYRKKLIITYDYHAYQNVILNKYPETIFDFGLVYENDTFDFSKENGKVIYTHKLADPFNTEKKIIGAYGIIKNKKGEFIELINQKDIDNFKKSSNMKFIWDAWFDRMVLKSVIKRICSVNFKDIVKNIEIIDNETNEPNRVSFDEKLLLAIDEATTIEQIELIYETNMNKIENKKEFIKLLEIAKTKLND